MLFDWLRTFSWLGGYADVTWFRLVVTLIASTLVTQLAVFATTIYLHRTATHRAIVLHPAVEFCFRAAIWVTTGILPAQWVAVHLKHHVFTDVVGDPHSPALEGFWKVQWGNVFYYVRELKADPGIVAKYAHYMKTDAWDRALFDRGVFGPISGTFVLCLALGLGWGLLAAGLHAFLYVFVLSSSVNGLCHHVGYRNFNNTATNIRLIAWLTGGEGLHNNHHGYPGRAQFSFKPGEFDPAWPVIQLLVTLGLAKIRHTRIEDMIAV